MPTILPTKSIYFNDVVLIQQVGHVESRKNVPNELYRCIVSPMPAVVGEKFVAAAAQCGLSITIPRNYSAERKINLNHIFKSNKINDNQLCFIGVGLNEDRIDIENLSHYAPDLLFDIANGLIPQLINKIERYYDISGYKPNNLMVGNVHTGFGLRLLNDKVNRLYNSSLFVRVGLSNGSGCRSYDETHYNRGQITELMECSSVKLPKNVFKVSDGGIGKPGYAAAAFGAGADYVLMGGYFSKSVESETHVIGDGTYWGCASEKENKTANLDKHSEGKIYKIDNELLPLSKICYQLWGGLSSAVSYSGYKTLTDFINNGVFEIKQNSLPPKKRY